MTPHRREHAGLRAWTQLVGGCAVLGVAAAVLLKVDLGMDPYGVLLQGLSKTTGASFGTVNVALGLLLAGVCWKLGGVRVAPGTIVQPVVTGVVIDLVLPHLPAVETLWGRLALGAGALVVLGVAAGTYLGAGLGSGPFDSVPGALARAWPHAGFGRRYGGALVVSLLVGVALGGSVGVATLMMVSVLGPLVAWARTTTQVSAPEDTRGASIPEQRDAPNSERASSEVAS